MHWENVPILSPGLTLCALSVLMMINLGSCESLHYVLDYQETGCFLSTPIFSYQAYYFDRDDQALHNFAKFFRHQSHEEREHAEKLMKMQNQRGGRIFLQDIRV